MFSTSFKYGMTARAKGEPRHFTVKMETPPDADVNAIRAAAQKALAEVESGWDFMNQLLSEPPQRFFLAVREIDRVEVGGDGDYRMAVQNLLGATSIEQAMQAAGNLILGNVTRMRIVEAVAVHEVDIEAARARRVEKVRERSLHLVESVSAGDHTGPGDDAVEAVEQAVEEISAGKKLRPDVPEDHPDYIPLADPRVGPEYLA